MPRRPNLLQITTHDSGRLLGLPTASPSSAAQVRLTDLLSGATADATLAPDATIECHIPDAPDFRFLRYDLLA